MMTPQTNHSIHSRRAMAALLAVASTAAAAWLSGCAIGSNATLGGSQTSSGAAVVQGRVMGGQQPVKGATIQLYAVSTTGMKNASTPLIGSSVTSGPTGNFNITGLYTCPTGSYVYLTATGGNPGLTGTVNNTGLSLMAAVGSCSAFQTNLPFIQVNELTTVAAVYSLEAFMADFQHVGAPSTNATGIQNAFATANNLVSLATGGAPGATLPATSTVPAAELNTLANIIATCVNTDGTGTPCANLFAASKSAGGATPSETIGALINIAANPAANVPTLFSLTASNPPFQPALTQSPNDWTVAITASGGGLSTPTAIALDATGTAWVANASGTSVTSLSPIQALRSGVSGYTSGNLLGPQGIAIDTSGNAWIANSYGGNVVKLDPNGNLLSPTGGYTLGGINSPLAIAIDASNNVWVSNFNSSTVSGLSTSGTVAPISGSPFTAGGSLNLPTGLTFDASANLWISSSGSNAVVKVSGTGSTLSGPSGYNDGYLQAPGGVAIDSAGRTFVAGTGLNEVSVFTTSTGAATNEVAGAGLVAPTGLVADGANVVFATDSSIAGSISMILSPTAAPITLGTLNAPMGIAVDASGNVWTANSGDNTVSQFVGLATPVRTPLALRFISF